MTEEEQDEPRGGSYFSPLQVHAVKMVRLNVESAKHVEVLEPIVLPRGGYATSFKAGVSPIIDVDEEGFVSWTAILAFKFTGSKKSNDRAHFKTVDAEFVGLFSLPKMIGAAAANKLTGQMCFSILYSTARGHISQVTGSMPQGPLLLPTVQMDLVPSVQGASAELAEYLQAELGQELSV